MSAEATGWVWKHSPFTGAPLLVHLAIADVVNDVHANQFWMTTSELAKKARVGRTATVTALRELVDGAFIDVVESGGGRGRGTVYRFRFPDTGRSAVSYSGPSLAPETGRLATETDRSAHETDRFAARIVDNPITQEPKGDPQLETAFASPADKARAHDRASAIARRLRGRAS